MAGVVGRSPSGIPTFWTQPAEQAAVAVVRIPNAWNVNDKSANLNLSNNDKTVTSATSPASGVRSTTRHQRGPEGTGKFYVEFLVGTFGRIGIKLESGLPNTATNTFYVASNGNIEENSNLRGSVGGAVSSGTVVCLAWDVAANLLWFRRNNGLWNNDALADPGTGINGISHLTVVDNANYALWFFSVSTGTSATVRTEVLEFSYSPPAGFTSWMGESLADVSGSLEVIEAADECSWSGTVGDDITGALAATEVGDVAALTGTIEWVATLAATEASDTAVLSGAVTWLGTLAATESPDAAGFDGLTGQIGTLAATEAADAAAFEGSIAAAAITGTFAATEAADTAAFAGTAITLGTLAATEGEDTATVAGLVGLAGTLAATETADLAVFTAISATIGTLAATEDADAFAGTGLVASADEVVGMLAATEAADAATFAGVVEEAPAVAVGGGRRRQPRLLPVVGIGFGILPELEGEAHGVVILTGAGVGRLPALVGAAAGTVGVSGRSAAQVALIRAAAVGACGQAGNAAAVLKGLSAASAGAAGMRGSGSGVIMKFTGAASGRHDDDEAVMAILLAA